MAETPTPILQLASQNPWHMLATAGTYHADNTRGWNGYMRHLIGDAAADNLKRADGTPICLPTLRSDEIKWIAEEIPDLPKNFPGSHTISLSGLLFAKAVTFQGFYFPVEAIFDGSTFAEYANFAGTTFAGEADFAGSIFKGPAIFTGTTFKGDVNFEASTFEANIFKGPAGFTGTTFAGDVTFEASIFKGPADFTGTTFAGDVDFEASIFKGEAEFIRSIFKGPAIFTGTTFKGYADFEASTFKGPADFGKSKYEDKTSFQNVTFKVAPLFFATTLHEDTDWTDVDWPAKPEDKEEATQYVRRYDRLALVMSTLKQPDNEHQFFRLSMQAKEVRDGKGISTSVSRFYGLFRYGWGLECALKLWVLHILFGAVCLSVMALWQRSQPLPDLAKIVTKIVQALAVSFSNSLPFLGLQRGPVENAHNSFHTLTGFDILWTIQSLSGPLLLFFLLLTIRNRFRLR